MEKVWFKLRQTDYPPPTLESMGTGAETGPICLGHFIESLKRMDFVLNRGAIKPFPPSMPVYPTDVTHFKWQAALDKHAGGGMGAGVPIAALAGATVKANVQLAFQQSVQGWEEYERLDTYIVQPNLPYVEDCLEGDELAAHVNGKLAWSVFMITGIKVARKGKKTVAEERHQGVEGAVKGDVLAVASGQIQGTYGKDDSKVTGGSHMSDFVWAVRLAKVSGNVLMENWSLKPYTERAAFSNEEKEVDIRATAEAEGLERFAVVKDSDLDQVIVFEVDS
ncbi:hypothetical protein FOPG_17915 [Fusarium oxysporum f. sp. conglutinans race 2 54008]|uniref:Uncharacterized protein n=3 Tax=Fusarium oxysporum f. sp. conglutinans TaxID=100902 RepID=A0A8H6GXU9_FUSOX|nr:hypothetical protein FOXB_16904 [Fusarium oxysporum f. sp. conglutinans Fo5176]EXL65886.1 hypothetical protein FOPG_17915 [Fusarium oxysporum f. sp. conglutinans race 2 54008]KAF6525682.1 hypothetical protein HZS61_011477 [Fusarium oxysporum f. sp. conglutinans]KAG6996202.1 hypothetical protein FocnCong_v015103 [Fusarium oxysporum f. sp. conglutinans]KAI8411115.1 hypothetical protein FOFC_07709 [Fusarium oxysporum]